MAASGLGQRTDRPSVYWRCLLCMFVWEAASRTDTRTGATTAVATTTDTTNNNKRNPTKIEYGVDVSFPMHHPLHRSNGMGLHPILPDRAEFYDSYLRGCKDTFGNVCLENEEQRMAMNRDQPRSMWNFTSAGYAKVKAPSRLYRQLKQYWELHHHNERIREEWSEGSTYVNHWAVDTHMVRIPSTTDTDDIVSEQKIIDSVQPVLEAWTGISGSNPRSPSSSWSSLVPTSVYGIREYHNNSVLAPHVDRLPLVCSVIINVAQSVDEPWPLELVGHDGNAINITMKPGDMVLYESHSVIHGRPFPLNGKFFANVFVHFEPNGYTTRHTEHIGSIHP